MKNICKLFSIFAFAFMFIAGVAAAGHAAETDIYAIQEQMDAKSAELDEEMSRQSPNRGKIERLSREIGELRGKELSARANGQSDARYYNGYDRPRGYGWHRGGGHYRGGHHRGGHGCW